MHPDKQRQTHDHLSPGGSTRAELDSLKSEIASSANKFLSTEDQKAVFILENVSKTHNIRMKIVDIGTSLLERLKFFVKGFSNTPLFVVNGKAIHDIENSHQLTALF